MLNIGDVLVGTPTLKPEYNWYHSWGPPITEEYEFFEALMELPVGYQQILEDEPHGEIKLHGDLIDLCLSKTCLLTSAATVMVNDENITVFEILCNTMTSDNIFEWRKLWVKKSILQHVLDNYSDYLQKL